MDWQPVNINGVTLELRDRGSGEPIVFVHGSMGDELVALLTQPALADHYRLVDYHRRGYGGQRVPRDAGQHRAAVGRLPGHYATPGH